MGMKQNNREHICPCMDTYQGQKEFITLRRKNWQEEKFYWVL